LPDIKVPGDAVVAQMDELAKRLNRLAYPRATATPGAPLALFGYVPASTGLRRGGATSSGSGKPPVQFDYTLSFALSAGPQRLCMLDGHLYAQGASLPDGGRIVTIEPERVLIAKDPLKRWVYLQEPKIGGELPAEARVPGQLPNEES